MEIILEGYVGKKAEAFIVESELDKLRKKIKKMYTEKVFSSSTIQRIYLTEEVKKIQLALSKLFKVKKVTLGIDLSTEYQAYTLCRSYIMLDKTNRMKNGRYESKNLSIGVFLSLGILLDDKFTSGEITAVIFHEMGHNFYKSPLNILSRLPLYQPLTTIAILGGMDIIMPAIIGGRKLNNDLIDRIPGATKVINSFKRVFADLDSIIPFVGTLSMVLLKGGQIAISPMKSIFNYNVEKFADSVASDYGYGQELGQALAKLTDIRDSRKILENNNTPIGLIYQLDTLFLENFSSIITGYPTNQNRIHTLINRMEQNLKDPSIPKDVKSDIEAELFDFKKWYEESYTTANEKDKRQLTMMYRTLINKTFNGKADIREIMAKADPMLLPDRQK